MLRFTKAFPASRFRPGFSPGVLTTNSQCHGVELNSFLEKYEQGISLEDNRPETLANLLQSLTGDQISTYKRRALEAGTTLCWEREEEVLMAVYEKLGI